MYTPREGVHVYSIIYIIIFFYIIYAYTARKGASVYSNITYSYILFYTIYVYTYIYICIYILSIKYI